MDDENMGSPMDWKPPHKAIQLAKDWGESEKHGV